ncbi:MAG: AMP-binding protein [bacterium]|nr:AMP-binding protein [bacterium]
MEGDAFVKWVETNGITMLQCVPGVFRQLNRPELTPENFKTLKRVMLAGEAINPNEIKNWHRAFANRIPLVNLYGTTETTILKTHYIITPGDEHRRKIPIGNPMRGAALILLDKGLNPCDQGNVGELYIRSPYLTAGYCNDRPLTQERFIPNPFTHDPDDIIYKTGDQAREMADGNIELLGRMDRQIKIRGIRIELEEIDTEISKHKRIKEAVVLIKETAHQEKQLCAYIVQEHHRETAATGEKKTGPGPESLNGTNALMEYLSHKLPTYMIPAYFIQVEKIPLTPNGKTDRKALSEIQIKNFETQKERNAPRNHLEKKLTEIWAGVLNTTHETIGIDNNFFQLGGHSLKATILVSKIHKQLEVKIPLTEIFRKPNIRELARYIERATKQRHTTIAAIEKKEYYPLSSAQKRMYIVQQIDTAGKSYNMPTILRMESNMQPERYRELFQQLTDRHESLRTAFIIVKGEPVQVVADKIDFSIENYEIEKGRNPEEQVEKIIRPFELSKAPLLRVGLIKIDTAEYILVADMHHIISDGISNGILERDFIAMYNNAGLPHLKIQYKEFAQWQNNHRKSGEIEKQKQYWLKKFQTGVPAINLPTDYPRPTVRRIEDGDFIGFQLEQDINLKLFQLVDQTDYTTYMVLLTAFVILLHKYTQQQDFVVGTPVAGRRHDDLQNVIGVFLNMLPMRNTPNGNKTFAQLLQEVKENALEAYENQDYQFDDLVLELGLHGRTDRNALFDVEFSLDRYEQNSKEKIAEKDMKFKQTKGIRKFAKFDLHFLAQEFDENMNILIRYSTALFKKSTVEKLKDYYTEILHQVLTNNDIKLKEIKISHQRIELKTSAVQKEDGEFLL